MDRPHVAIVGGGFGGLSAARELGGGGYDVTLLDQRNFHTFQPLLYQVAAGMLTTGDIATPYRLVLRGQDNVRVLMAGVRDIDPHRRTITHDRGELTYDILIAATGVQHSYFGMEQWSKHAPGLKTLEHALEMRRRIFRALELAELETDASRRRTLMNFIVVGAGPTGVELAGALAELTMRHMSGDYRSIDPRLSRIYLIEGAPQILPNMPEPLRKSAHASLEELGVIVMTDTSVTAIEADYVFCRRDGSSERIDASTILWAAGVQASGFGTVLAQRTGTVTDRSGRLPVNADLSLAGFPEIFVIGDLAQCKNGVDKTVPGLAPAAIQMGRYVAHLLHRRRRGKPIAAFRYRDQGCMAVVGRNHAVGDLRIFQVTGIVAWWLWALVHIRSLIQPEKQMRVFVQWAWRYFSRQTGDRLITGEREMTTAAMSSAPAETSAKQIPQA